MNKQDVQKSHDSLVRLYTQGQLCLNCSRIAQRIILEPLVPPPQLYRQERGPQPSERLFTYSFHKDLKASEIAQSLISHIVQRMTPLFNLRSLNVQQTSNKEYLSVK